MEFKDKRIQAEYDMLSDREYTLECELDDIRERLSEIERTEEKE